MEYKLNKIDMELRERINDATSEEKIHRKKEIQRVKGKKNDDRKNENSKEEAKFVLPKRPLKGSKIIVTSLKDNDNSIDVDAIKENTETSIIDKGNFLDVRR